MQHRGVMLSRGLVYLCIASLFVQGLFALPAAAQEGPAPGTPAQGTNPDSPSSPPTLITIAAQDCRVSEDASVTVEDGDGTQARFVNGQRGIKMTSTSDQIRIEGPSGDFIGDHAVSQSDPGFDTDGDYTVVSTTGISCQGTGANQQPADDNAGATQGADDDQYGAAEAEKGNVIVKTIPDKILVDTGGPSLAMIGVLLLSVGLVGLGILVLRRV
jgi:hypothetical protein